MKIYTNILKENWVVDNVIKEWNEYQQDIVTLKIRDADIIWIIAPWTWRKLPKLILKNKKVVCTIHHIDFDKFNDKEKKEFYRRDKYVDYYHTVSAKSREQIQTLTDKKIFQIPFWINQNKFFELKDKVQIREELNISLDSYVVGSFQRDTEGSDLKSPKLSKGPDRFLKIARDMKRTKKNLTIILTGKRRNYLIENFEKENIDYKYFEMVDFQTLNKLYNILDLYVITSRVEGGPRSLFECAITKTPIISTNVGFASDILSPESIYDSINYKDAKPNIEYSKKIVKNYEIPNGINNFIDMFSEINES